MNSSNVVPLQLPPKLVPRDRAGRLSFVEGQSPIQLRALRFGQVRGRGPGVLAVRNFDLVDPVEDFIETAIARQTIEQCPDRILRAHGHLHATSPRDRGVAQPA